MTKANKTHLLKIQAVFGGSLDYCKRNYRVNENGVIVRTSYDAIRTHEQDAKALRIFLHGGVVSNNGLYNLVRELRKYYK